MDVNQDTSKLHPFICTTFFFAYVWAIGGNLITKSIENFDSFARELFNDTNDVKVSPLYSLPSLSSYDIKDPWQWRSV